MIVFLKNQDLKKKIPQTQHWFKKLEDLDLFLMKVVHKQQCFPHVLEVGEGDKYLTNKKMSHIQEGMDSISFCHQLGIQGLQF
jgi:hypothetical protein